MATKDKAQKKSKLRHAEYYDFQKIQDKLYADSQICGTGLAEKPVRT